MKCRKTLLIFLLVTAIVGIAALLSYNYFNDTSEFISWEELTPGEKGYGLTVFKGTEPEKFEVEFDGVIPHPLYPKEKLILVRMGEPLQGSNVLAGMSGSPVYFPKKREAPSGWGDRLFHQRLFH